MTPSLGVEGGSILEPGHWTISLAFRFYNSRQDVVGDDPQDEDKPIVYANTHVYGWDFNAVYAVTKRLNAVLDVPFQYGTRGTFIDHDNIHLHTMKAGGLGDMRLRADFWLLDPAKHPNQNIAVGLGVKFPTGVYDASDTVFRPTGQLERPVDPAIQPGDGGWGIVFHSHGFTSLASKGWLKNTYAYFDGTYLANPREMNDTQQPEGDLPMFTAGGDPGLVFDSVPDQFLVRLGFTQVGFPVKELSWSFGGRWEGDPSHDLIGGSEGWRLPGYSISVEPGISYSRGNDFVALTVPIAIFRHGSKSQPFERLGVPKPPAGTATIADYAITLTYTHTF